MGRVDPPKPQEEQPWGNGRDGWQQDDGWQSWQQYVGQQSWQTDDGWQSGQGDVGK